ncbi:LADA_0G03686g1_1 [Lachancea dasiensis]|uniref:LADA_0G03686g1_1 n=1 Tax=Lachancea dasiensis TaxID=1072105 RepID=A0A1G4JRT8_9SACH|nr:LADA_0G03686g1_1 [Lachancea dasiensis]
MKFAEMDPKPAILFISKPELTSKLYNTTIKDHFQIIHYDFATGDRESFLDFLKDNFDPQLAPLTAIYGGFPAFHPIGGLTAELLDDSRFPKNSLKCIVLCSRGVNGIDFEALKKYKVKLYNYTDEEGPATECVGAIEIPGLVGNDVADCALWHVIEGYRKFSYQQLHLRKTGHTLEARRSAAGEDTKSTKFMFGESLKSYDVKSPKGQKGLILGLGGIGKQIALKLQYGLGMEIHYAKRTPDSTVPWTFHALDQTLYPKLKEFTTIVVALPGTPETKHLIDSRFLHACARDVIFVNIGRGVIFEPTALEQAIESTQIRHFGGDVFYHEPDVEKWLLANDESVTITPHIGSGTKGNYYQSCEFALTNIIQEVLEKSEGHSRVV